MELYLIEKIERNNGDLYKDICINFDETKPISIQIQHAYNMLGGDMYTWPGDDVSKTEVDKWFSLGKRFFVFQDPYGNEIAVLILDEQSNIQHPERDHKYIFEIVKLRDIIEELCLHFDCSGKHSETQKALDYIKQYYEGEFADSILKQILGTDQQTRKL
jgi:hypothetical protein